MALGSTFLAGVTASIACAISSLSGVGPIQDTSFISNNAFADQEFIEIVEELERYVVVEDDVLIFDTVEAERDSVPSDILELGETFNDFSQAHEEYDHKFDDGPKSEAAVVTTSTTAYRSSGALLNDPRNGTSRIITAGVPIWGNWCGPGHGGGKAKDTLDSLCRTHDLCYRKKGYFACSCDRAIVKGINARVHKMKRAEKRRAAVVSVYFKVSPRNPFK